MPMHGRKNYLWPTQAGQVQSIVQEARLIWRVICYMGIDSRCYLIEWAKC